MVELQLSWVQVTDLERIKLIRGIDKANNPAPEDRVFKASNSRIFELDLENVRDTSAIYPDGDGIDLLPSEIILPEPISAYAISMDVRDYFADPESADIDYVPLIETFVQAIKLADTTDPLAEHSVLYSADDLDDESIGSYKPHTGGISNGATPCVAVTASTLESAGFKLPERTL